MTPIQLMTIKETLACPGTLNTLEGTRAAYLNDVPLLLTALEAAEQKATHYERDWREAKHEWHVGMKKLNAKLRKALDNHRCLDSRDEKGNTYCELCEWKNGERTYHGCAAVDLGNVGKRKQR